MNTSLRSLLILFIIALGIPALAQDSLRLAPDTTTVRLDPSDTMVVRENGQEIPIESYAARYDPRRAILLAAVFPGAGQAYNRKFWKIPLVYGGFGGLGYAIWWNQGRYAIYRKALFSLLNEPANPVVDQNGYTRYGNLVVGGTRNGNLVVGGKVYYPVPGTSGYVGLDVARNAVNKYRRDRDYMVIMTFIFYAMQMIDAHVDAHLKEFDLNPQLKVSIEPTINQNAFIGRSTGFGITLKF